MGNLRATLIAAVAIPASLISTFTLMDYLGFTINNLTMLALVLATGVVIDDAVVVLENIFRHMEERGESAMSAAVVGTREIGLAVMATTFSLVIIFLPVAFMSGRVGRFFHSYGITTAVAIMVSLLVSFTLTPMLCSRFLKVAKHSKSRERGFYAAIDRGYGAMLRWSLAHRWVIILYVLTVAHGPIFRPRKDFLPQTTPASSRSSYRRRTATAWRAPTVCRAEQAPSADVRACSPPATCRPPQSRWSGHPGRDLQTAWDLEGAPLAETVMQETRQMLTSIRTCVSACRTSTFSGGGQRQTEVEFTTVASLAKLEYPRIIEPPRSWSIDTTCPCASPSCASGLATGLRVRARIRHRRTCRLPSAASR
jgi:hypothetical protein